MRNFLPDSYSNGLISGIALIAVALQTGTAGPAGAGERVGETVVVKNLVSASGGDVGTRQLAVSDGVNSAEVIAASADSHGELKLNDNSLVIVGEGASVSLDDFVVSGGNTFQTATLKVTKGAFRFITGDSPKAAFNIQTPLADIGVRGTVFDVYVDDGTGNTRVVLFEGAVTVCNQARQCLIAQRGCDIIEVSSRDQIGFLPFLRSAGRTRGDEAAQFGLSERQNRFSDGFRASTGRCNARAAQEAANGRPEYQNNTHSGQSAPQRSDPPSRGDFQGRDNPNNVE